MYKYAEIYGGIVRDLKESNLGFAEFASIWDPTAFWLDVTGLTDEDIQVGWLLKSDPERGTYFAAPEVQVDPDSFEIRKAAKLELLSLAFQTVQETAYIVSSLGFRANAGARAYRDVDGLIKRMKAENLDTVMFRDFDNVLQPVTLDEAQTLELEIIKNGQAIYLQKWAFEDAIGKATTVEELDKIIISFDMLDFFSTPYAGDTV